MDDVAGVAVEALLPFRVPPSGVTRGVLDRGVTRGVLERGVASSLLSFRVPPSGVTRGVTRGVEERGVLERGVLERGVLERGVASSPRLNLTSKMVNCINLKS